MYGGYLLGIEEDGRSYMVASALLACIVSQSY